MRRSARAGQRQREIDRELVRLEAQRNADPPRKMEVKIDLTAEAATPATLRVSYSVRGARWSPIYDARLDSGARDRKPALELVRRAEIVQNTGEDWRDVDLAVSTVRTAKGGSAPDLRPLIVRLSGAASRRSRWRAARVAPLAASPPSRDEGRPRRPRGRARSRRWTAADSRSCSTSATA